MSALPVHPLARPARLFAMLAVLVSLGSSTTAWARWQWYDQHNNLSGRAIWQVVEDAGGRVWLADRGDNLLRNDLDGWPLTGRLGDLAEYTIADAYSIYPLQALATGADSSTWFAITTHSGFYPEGETEAQRFPGSRTFPAGSGPLIPGLALAIAPVQGDAAFISTSTGLYRTSDPAPSGRLTTPFTPAPPGRWITPMTRDRDGVLWVGVSEGGLCGFASSCRGAWLGVARLEGDHWRLYTTTDGLAPEPVVGLLQSPDGALWAIHLGLHVSRFDGTGWTVMEAPFKSVANQITAWASDPRDGFWLAATGALSHFGSGAWRTFGAEEDVPANPITALCVDHCGQVWVGLEDGRVGRFADELRGDPRAPAGIQRLFEDAAGTLWATNPADSLRAFDGLRWIARGQGLPGGQGLVFQTRAGALWACSNGVWRFDGSAWVDCCADTASPIGGIDEMSEGPGGLLWFLGGGDVWRYDGAGWRHFRRGADFDTTAADPFPLAARLARRPQAVQATFPEHRILADSSGRLWVTAASGCSMFENGVWRDFRVRDNLGFGAVLTLRESPQGDVWASQEGYGNLSRFHDGAWITYPTPTNGLLGLGQDIVFDRAGDLWVIGYVDDSGTERMLARFRADHWDTWREAVLPEVGGISFLGLTPAGETRIASWTRTFSPTYTETWTLHYTFWDGERFVSAATPPESTYLRVLYTQRAGRLWLQDAAQRLQTFDPDRTPPQTVLLAAPAALTPERTPSLTALATRTEPIGIEYSFRLDGNLDTGWSPSATWQTPSLTDGDHVLDARARDALENVDPIPARVRFTVDGTAPVVALTAPSFDAVVRGTAPVRGSITEAHLARYVLRIRSASADIATWDTLASGTSQPSSDTLAVLATDDRADGSYDLALDAEDALGLHSNVTSRIRIDNVAPDASRISPVEIERDNEGEVFSEDLYARAYFPPGSFASRTRVDLAAIRADSVAQAGIPNFTAARGYRLAWSATALEPNKVAILELSTAGLPGPGRWIIERRAADGQVDRRGGTFDPARAGVSVPVTIGGEYYLGVEDTVSSAGGGALSLALSPRVFNLRALAGLSATGGEMSIAFGLAQPARVTMAVYDRAGRLVRHLVDHETMPVGDHVVRWNGRDEDGQLASDGIYLINAEIGERRQTLPFAVVR